MVSRPAPSPRPSPPMGERESRRTRCDLGQPRFRACFPGRLELQIARMKKLILGLTLAVIACVSAQAGDDKKACEQACADKAKATCSEAAKAACADKAKVAGTDCSGCTGKAKFTRKVDINAKGATLLLVRR